MEFYHFKLIMNHLLEHQAGRTLEGTKKKSSTPTLHYSDLWCFLARIQLRQAVF